MVHKEIMMQFKTSQSQIKNIFAQKLALAHLFGINH